MNVSREAAARDIIARLGVADDLAGPLGAFIVALLENQGDDGIEAIDQALLGTMSGDDYYDHLEGWWIGHRNLRTWIREKRAGDDVFLTKAGRVIAGLVNAELAIFPAVGGAV